MDDYELKNGYRGSSFWGRKQITSPNHLAISFISIFPHGHYFLHKKRSLDTREWAFKSKLICWVSNNEKTCFLLSSPTPQKARCLNVFIPTTHGEESLVVCLFIAFLLVGWKGWLEMMVDHFFLIVLVTSKPPRLHSNFHENVGKFDC